METIRQIHYLTLTDESKRDFKIILNRINEYTPEFKSLARMYPQQLKALTNEILSYTESFIDELENHPEQVLQPHFYNYLTALEKYSSSIILSMPAIAVTLCNTVISSKMKLLRLKEFKPYRNNYS